MDEPARYLRALATRIAAAYVELCGARAILLTGSVAEGSCDFHSDIDTILYYNGLPSGEALAQACSRNQGEGRKSLGPGSPTGIGEEYRVRGVSCQFVHCTIAGWEQDMAAVLERLEARSVTQKALSGLLAGFPLHGEPLIRRWQARAAEYPQALARAMVEAHLSFLPIWSVKEWVLARDASLWLRQVLVEAEQNLLGVLAGVNRRYYSTFQLKRMRHFVDTLSIAPHALYERLQSLLETNPATAIDQLEALVQETVALVEAHLPEVDTAPVRQTLGRRRPAWELPSGGWDAGDGETVMGAPPCASSS
jgi:hypothetical protein